VYSVTIVGNVEQCRTEAEISDGEGVTVAVVYEASDGWHTDILEEHRNQATSDFKTIIDNAKESLSHYVNRRGENAPENASWGAFSLWLMIKDDGTAMGMSVKDDIKS
jgi:hypothetical protein